MATSTPGGSPDPQHTETDGTPPASAGARARQQVVRHPWMTALAVLALAIIVGRRIGWKREPFRPHNLPAQPTPMPEGNPYHAQMREKIPEYTEKLTAWDAAVKEKQAEFGIDPEALAPGIEVVQNGLLHSLERQAEGFLSVEL